MLNQYSLLSFGFCQRKTQRLKHLEKKKNLLVKKFKETQLPSNRLAKEKAQVFEGNKYKVAKVTKIYITKECLS